MASIVRRGDSWCVRWREGGRGSQARQISVSSEQYAIRLKDEIEEALERYGRYEPARPVGPTPLRVALDAFIADSARRHRPRTTQRYAQHLVQFRTWCGESATVGQLSWDLLSDYHLHLSNPATGRHLHARSPETVRKHIECLELFWQWAWTRQARKVFQGVPQPDSLELQREAAPRKVAPSWAQMDAMIGCSDGWQHDLYVVLRCTGLRVDQALRLQWDDLRLDRDVPVAHIRPELGKTKSERRGRWVPLAPVLVQVLAGWGRREGPLLTCDRKKREARARDAQRAWQRAGVDCAVWEGCAHHAFRAGFQSALKRDGADTEAVEYLVGHSLGDVRERYLDPEALPLVTAVRLVPPIGETEEPKRIGLEGAS
jgi:integrase